MGRTPSNFALAAGADSTISGSANGAAARTPSSTLFRDDEWVRIGTRLGLAKREREIAKLLFDGVSEKEIGPRLQLSDSTVHTYVQRLYLRLHVTTRAQMLVTLFASFVEDIQSSTSRHDR